MQYSVGSVCSGIEAASVAFDSNNFKFKWFSEIADFPSRILNEKYPDTPNLGDMNNIPELIQNNKIEAPSIICGGTPCQAFSLAGTKNGLNDNRGNLTLKFIDIINANDYERKKLDLPQTIVLWENVEGILTDKTNAFGCFVSSLTGIKTPITDIKWPSSGFIHGKKRNIAWRVIDAKYFGLPQQRKRLYLLAGGKDFFPEKILFESHSNDLNEFPKYDLTFEKENTQFEVFREYTDCLYSAYGTKWNGNAAATNGSLFVVQNSRIRRLSPLEAERLMGFPDNYTNINNAKNTSRYQAIGNSWAIPVIKWIGTRLHSYLNNDFSQLIKSDIASLMPSKSCIKLDEECFLYSIGKKALELTNSCFINGSMSQREPVFANIKDIISPDNSEDFYISPVGCFGIVRRKIERNAKINSRLEEVLLSISSEMHIDEIEKRSLKQKRGRFSKSHLPNITATPYENVQLSLFDCA